MHFCQVFLVCVVLCVMLHYCQRVFVCVRFYGRCNKSETAWCCENGKSTINNSVCYVEGLPTVHIRSVRQFKVLYRFPPDETTKLRVLISTKLHLPCFLKQFSASGELIRRGVEGVPVGVLGFGAKKALIQGNSSRISVNYMFVGLQFK